MKANNSIIDNRHNLGAWSFGGGAVFILCWFVWVGSKNASYLPEEWVIFYGIALLCWQPMAAWLSTSTRWIPAGEAFFLLHLPYYVGPFLRGDPAYTELASDQRLKIGLAVAVFVLACRFCYRVGTTTFLNSRVRFFLDREIAIEWRNQIAWGGLITWTLFMALLQQGWMPNLGTFFNTVQSLLSNVATIGLFILYYEFAKNRQSPSEKRALLAITTVSLFFQSITGFLIGSAMQCGLIFLAISFARRKLPVVLMVAIFMVFAFLHLGKGDMRAQFWDEDASYATAVHNPLAIIQFWSQASWNRLWKEADDDDGRISLIARGNLLPYLSRVVRDTPDSSPHLNGITYLDSLAIFVPRFLWADKPRSSSPNDTLVIYYNFLTKEDTERTAVGMGRISEAWANFGWFGIVAIGALSGLIFQIPAKLSLGFSPLHVRFLLSVPFLAYGMKLEEVLGPGLHALTSGLLLTSVVLWFAAFPSEGVRSNDTSGLAVGPSTVHELQ